MSAPDIKRTLHIRCGSDIEETLRMAGFIGDFLEFADPFCQGPVPAEPDLGRFIQIRCQFIAAAYHLDPKQVAFRQSEAYAGLKRAADFEQVVLWFEHDSFDQLILAFLLDHFSATAPNLELICVDQVAGVRRFTGLGQLTPQHLNDLWHSQRRPVGPDHFALGREVWRALTAPHADPLEIIIAQATPAVPCMASALERHLQELPSSRNGLGLTQQLTLELLADKGPLSAGHLFRCLSEEREPLPYLGDLMFRYVLDDLCLTPETPFTIDATGKSQPWNEQRLSINKNGERLLDGKANFMDRYRGRRFVGGIELKSGDLQPRR